MLFCLGFFNKPITRVPQLDCLRSPAPVTNCSWHFISRQKLACDGTESLVTASISLSCLNHCGVSIGYQPCFQLSAFLIDFVPCDLLHSKSHPLALWTWEVLYSELVLISTSQNSSHWGRCLGPETLAVRELSTGYFRNISVVDEFLLN